MKKCGYDVWNFRGILATIFRCTRTSFYILDFTFYILTLSVPKRARAKYEPERGLSVIPNIDNRAQRPNEQAAH